MSKMKVQRIHDFSWRLNTRTKIPLQTIQGSFQKVWFRTMLSHREMKPLRWKYISFSVKQCQVCVAYASYCRRYTTQVQWHLLYSPFPREENGSPLQYSGLENSMDRGARRTIDHGIARVGHDLATKHHHILLSLQSATLSHSPS